jgi:predicted enzyme related to lactoylglutathione lyase
MNRLAYLILHTPQLGRMQSFYREHLRLPVRSNGADRVEFDTAGATLVLQSTNDPERRGVELRLLVDDVETRMNELGGRGVRFEGGIQRRDDGAVAGLWDSEGTMLSLMTPRRPYADGRGPRLATAIVNCRDLAGAKAFYRNVMGLHPAVDTAWWVEFDTGPSHLSLHPRLSAADRDHHHSRPLTWSFEVDDLIAWIDSCRQRGVAVPTAPHDTPYGMMADLEDPDGNLFIVNEPSPEDDDIIEDETPHRDAIRKPGRVRAKAVSRVAIRPERSAATPQKRRKPSATTRTVAKVRGAGKDHARLKPKRTADEKKAKAKPAIGRLVKAVSSRKAQQKRATARASRGKIAKRSSNKARARAARVSGRGRGRR